MPFQSDKPSIKNSPYLGLFKSTERRRAQRGVPGRSGFKKYFSFIFILTGFLFNNYKCVFLFWILGRGVRGEFFEPRRLIIVKIYSFII